MFSSSSSSKDGKASSNLEKAVDTLDLDKAKAGREKAESSLANFSPTRPTMWPKDAKPTFKKSPSSLN